MNRKLYAAIALDLGIALCTALSLYFLYSIEELGFLRIVAASVVLTAFAAVMVYEIVCWSRQAKKLRIRVPLISVLTLLGEDDRPIRVWDITGKVGLLIGKSDDEYQVDIDLSGTDHNSFIDPEHAMLNYYESGWWLQDVSSRNGVSVIRKSKEIVLGHFAPMLLEPGDVICVAHFTRISVN